jgi:hypothetical protein
LHDDYNAKQIIFKKFKISQNLSIVAVVEIFVGLAARIYFGCSSAVVEHRWWHIQVETFLVDDVVGTMGLGLDDRMEDLFVVATSFAVEGAFVRRKVSFECHAVPCPDI